MDEEKETGRIEAFSDGVFAIAITLLILNIQVPKVHDLRPGMRLARALLEQWPAYVSYITSFLTILIMWANHHKLFLNIKRTDHYFLLINGLLLMGVTVIPFPTALVAEYIQHRDAPLATEVLTGSYLVIAILFNLLWHYAAHGNRLLSKNSDPGVVQNITRQYRFGPLLYLIDFALAFVNVAASITLCLLMAIFFALPPDLLHSGSRDTSS